MKNPIRKKKDEGSVGGGVIIAHTELIARHIGKDGKEISRRIVRDRVVTNVFVYDIADVLQGTSGSFDLYKWHGYGTSTAAESATSTGIGTAIGGYRTGTQTEGGSSNIYASVATITATGTHAITEHGLFNSSSPGTLMDRTLFAAINVVSGEKIEFTFQITFSAGG